ncbi:M48 family metalloprotease [Microseira sp. BLCC-F43]|jgi:Zn-dependent protease with chaperone function|uniref:M48 family metalloprotease n=1 Tax=Microseira sp. BLCC-F43 TaxID=3153602 RepID=UPI0035B9C87B
MTSLPDSSVEAGLAALKKGDFNSAIPHLESVCDVEIDPATIVRAQMGLVVAYNSSGNMQKAIALCQHLTTSVNPQVKQWADNKLAEITHNSTSVKPTPTENPTGFVPLDQIPQINQPSSKQSTEVSGFVPLENIPPQENRQVIPPLGKAGEQASRGAGEQGSAVGAGFTNNLTTPSDNLTKPAPVGEQKSRKDTVSRNVPAPEPSSLLASKQASSRPADSVSSSGNSTSYSPQPHTWRQAQRAQRWQPLPVDVGFKPDLTQLWGVQIVTAIALFWMLRLILQFGAAVTNDLFVKLPYLEPIQAFYGFYYQPTLPILIGLAILLVLSPWLIDGLLKLFYGNKPFSVETLKTHSQEAARVLQRLTRERRIPVPKLGILPTDAPLALTYGNLPNTARIVVSKGLLEQLTDDEIGAIYAAQMGQIRRWDFVLMSLGVLVAQIPYTIYRLVAEWGEQWEGPILRGTTGAIGQIAYAIYWLLRWPLVWLSRIRVYFSDRFSCDVTGNPNGLSRAILKIAIGIAKDIEQQGKTTWLLEGFDLLMPLGYRQAIGLGSVHAYTAFEPVLAWDVLNPYSRWLAWNNSHPLTGDRLQLLSRYARHWKLETELDFSSPTGKARPNSAFRLQAAPYFGILIGLILGALLWLLGEVGSLARIRLLSWLLDDYWFFLRGFVLSGFSIGTLIRINSFFPDITPSTRADETTLPDLLGDPDALPIDSQPVRFPGKLLGRPGIANWLGQDLILQSGAGLVKLHYLSWLGPIGNIILGTNRPSHLINRSVTVSGWFRRGATPWIDIEAIATSSGKTSPSGHPVWSTILATGSAVVAAYIILKGGF